MKSLCFAAALAAASTVLLPSKQAAAEDYDMDCAVILCMAGGFPQGCAAAYSYMIGRLKDLKPPFGVCTMGSGEDYNGHDVNFQTLRGRNQYLCPEGSQLYYRDEYDGDNTSLRVFCYTGTERREVGDGEWETVYLGQSNPQMFQYSVRVSIDTGSGEDFVSPTFYINAGSGTVVER